MKVELIRSTKNMLRLSEACARICYNSFRKINEDSTDIIKNTIVPLGHEQIIESNLLIFRVTDANLTDLFDISCKSKLQLIKDLNNSSIYIIGNIRMIKDLFRSIENNITDMIKEELYKFIPYQFFVNEPKLYDISRFSNDSQDTKMITLDMEAPFQVLSKMFVNLDDLVNFIDEYDIYVTKSDMRKFDFASVLINDFSRSDANQLVRHREASFAQRSQRYVKETDFNITLPKDFTGNTDSIVECIDNIRQEYNGFIKNGMKAEHARAILPNCTSTKIIISCTGKTWDELNVKRAMNSHAQYNIRTMMSNIIDAIKIK